MNKLQVLFRDRSSPSYSSRKLFEFRAYADSLDHLDCSHGVLALLCNNFFISGSKCLSHQWRQLLELTLVLFLSSIWISDCLCLARIATRNQDEFTVSFILRRKFIFLFFEEAVRILSLCEFSWSFGLQPWCTGSILFKEANFSPINEGSCWNLPLCYFSWPFGFQIVYVWLTWLLEIRMNSL